MRVTVNSVGQTNSHSQIALTDFNKPVPIQITLPAQVGSANTQPRTLTIQVPASALHGNFHNISILFTHKTLYLYQIDFIPTC